jgi:hypothetical protein
MNKILGLLLIVGLMVFGCCGSTASQAEGNRPDPYAQFYGRTANVSSTYSIVFNKYSEELRSDETKDVTISFTAINDGTEQDSVNGGLFVTDDKGRNYQANPFLCSTLINPGLSAKVDCQFLEIPKDAKIVALKLGDSMFEKGKYTTLIEFT